MRNSLFLSLSLTHTHTQARHWKKVDRNAKLSLSLSLSHTHTQARYWMHYVKWILFAGSSRGTILVRDENSRKSRARWEILKNHVRGENARESCARWEFSKFSSLLNSLCEMNFICWEPSERADDSSARWELSKALSRKNPPPPGGFPIYYVPSSRTVSKGTPLEEFIPGASRGVLLLTVLDGGT